VVRAHVLRRFAQLVWSVNGGGFVEDRYPSERGHLERVSWAIFGAKGAEAAFSEVYLRVSLIHELHEFYGIVGTNLDTDSASNAFFQFQAMSASVALYQLQGLLGESQGHRLGCQISAYH